MAKGKDLTMKDVEKVEELLHAGMEIDAIARILEIAPISVKRIKKRRTHFTNSRKQRSRRTTPQRIAPHIYSAE